MALRGSTVSASNGHQDKVGGIDEIEQYIRSRYLSSCEADWRIFGFDIHGRTPAVERLIVHLPGMNMVTYH